jgi:type IV pilus assembly protein PilM
MKILKDIRFFFEDMVNIFKTGSVLGVDIGTSSIKAIEISKKKNILNLENYGVLNTLDYLSHPNLALQMSSLDIVEKEVSNLLKVLISEMKIKTDRVLLSIPDFASFTTFLDMPMMSDKEISRSVKFQARKYIPMDLDKIEIDWQKVGSYKNDSGKDFLKVLLIGIPKKVISSYTNICKGANLKVYSMELASIASVRAFPKFERPTLLVDIGAESTTSLVTEKGLVNYSGQADYGGIHITKALNTSLDLSMDRSDELKKRKGFLSEKGGSELSTLVLPFLDVIIQEVDYVRDVYEKRYGKKVEQFSLFGGGANLDGIDNYFEKQLDLRKIDISIFSDINYPTSIEPAMRLLKNELPIAIGLTKKYFLN